MADADRDLGEAGGLAPQDEAPEGADMTETPVPAVVPPASATPLPAGATVGGPVPPSGTSIHLPAAQVGRDLIIQNIQNAPPAASDDRPRKNEEDQVGRFAVRPETLKKAERVFVSPAVFQQTLEKRKREMRVLLVDGPVGSGRSACALGLGRELIGTLPDPQYQFIRPIQRTLRSLMDLVKAIKPKPGHVYIVENVFDTGMPRGAFEEKFLDIVNGAELPRDAFLIMTASGVDRVFDHLLPVVHNQGHALELVLDKHLAWYTSGDALHLMSEAVAKMVRRQQAVLLRSLQSPVAIDVFCLRCSAPELGQLAEREPARLEENLQRLAQDVGTGDQLAAAEWFRNLTPNARLFALLLGLFRGIERPLLEEIYTGEAQRLRSEGLSYRDAREFGFEDLYETLNVRLDTMEFAERAREIQIQRQLSNYNHLLWSVMDTVKAAIEEYKHPRYWWFRQLLGKAIGRFGVHNHDRSRDLLEELGRHPHGGIASAAGHALQEMCRLGAEHQSFALQLLLDWGKQKEPNLIWSAAVALGRVYEEVVAVPERAREARQQLTELAGNHDAFNQSALGQLLSDAEEELDARFDRDRLTAEQVTQLTEEIAGTRWAELVRDNRDALVRTIQNLFVLDPIRTVELLQSWLRETEETAGTDEPDHDDPDAEAQEEKAEERPNPTEEKRKHDNRRLVGQSAGFALFLQSRDHQLLVPERHEKLMELLLDLLDADQENIVDPALRVLLGWLQNTGWTTRIQNALLRAVNRATPRKRRQLCRALFRSWLSEDDPETRQLSPEVRAGARRIAEMLLERARILDGAVCDMPGGPAGILVIDAGIEGRVANSAARSGHDFYQLLRGQARILLRSFGQTAPLAARGEALTLESFRSRQERPRLLFPVLERLEREGVRPDQVHFVLAPTWGDILDEQDIQESQWRDKLLAIHIGGQTRDPSELPDYIQEVLSLAKPSVRRQWLKVLGFDATELSQQNQAMIENFFVTVVEQLVTPRLAHCLARRSMEEWRRLLQPELPELGDDPETARQLLEQQATLLDGVPEEGRCDTARLLACGVQWLALRDMKTAVSLVLDWLRAPGDDPRLALGLACAFMLLQVQVAARLRPGGKELGALDVEVQGPLLRLAPVLIRQEQRTAVELLLHMARCCASIPEWNQRLRQGELVELMRKAPATEREWLLRQLERWTHPLGDEKKTPVATLLLADWLKLHLRAKTKIRDDSKHYGVIIVDNQRKTRERLNKLARVLFADLEKLKGDGLQLILYKMGELAPVAMSGDKVSQVLPPEGAPQPSLLAPLLESLPSERVRFVLVLAGSRPLDLDDCDPEWGRKAVFSYEADSRKPGWAPPWEFLGRQATTEAAQSELLRLLKPLVEAPAS
jgi:hypothetical protein